MRKAVLSVVLLCLCASGWVMYARETKVSGAFREEIEDAVVIVPYGFVDKITRFKTREGFCLSGKGSPSIRLSFSAWNELHGLVLASMLGVTGDHAVTSTGWETANDLPQEMGEILSKEIIVQREPSARRWLYFELGEPVFLGSIKVSRYLLYGEMGSRISGLYVDGGDGVWIHARTTVSGDFLDAYIRDTREQDD